MCNGLPWSKKDASGMCTLATTEGVAITTILGEKAEIRHEMRTYVSGACSSGEESVEFLKTVMWLVAE